MKTGSKDDNGKKNKRAIDNESNKKIKKINKDVFLIREGLFFKEKKILCLADLHIGFEEAMQVQGVLLPRFQFKDMVKRLEEVLDIIKKKFGLDKLEEIIINGDLKHEFGTISKQEWKETIGMLDFLKKKTKKIILVKGNHDTILGPIAKKQGLKIVQYYQKDDLLFAHGDREVEELKIDLKKVKTIIIGHEHPAVGIREGQRREVFKCFLVGEWQSKEGKRNKEKKRKPKRLMMKKVLRGLIIQPSFNPVMPGTDVLKESLLSLVLINLGERLKKFKVVVVSDEGEVLEFGKLGGL